MVDQRSPNLESLLEQNLPRLRAFVRLRMSQRFRDRESCSDLVQSVCRELLTDRSRFEFQGEAAFRNWLFVQALDKIRDRARYHQAQKRDARKEVAPDSAADERYGEYYRTIVTPSRVAIGREELERVERAFEELPERAREIITLSRLVGLSRAEIADQLQLDERQVSNALYRGLRKLSWVLTQEA